MASNVEILPVDEPPLSVPPEAGSSEPDEEWYIPSDIRAVLQGGLFVIALLGVCYVAAEVMLPITLSFVLKLVLQPVMRMLEGKVSA